MMVALWYRICTYHRIGEMEGREDRPIEKGQQLLSIRDLKTEFKLKDGTSLRAVDGINLDIETGEIHGLVGESGCGKTVTSLSILNLIQPPGFISNGEIIWNGNNLLALTKREMRLIRGREIAMIFQNPQASLNPLYSIGDQLISVMKLHRHLSKNEAYKEAFKLLKVVKIPDPKSRINDYPHQLSGGMCQRAMIAMTIACKPKLLIADEPTAALDVTIQAQILELLLELRERFQMSMLLISHDMGVVANMCDRISVMYLGRIVEESDTENLYSEPKHPYTQALLKSVPVPIPSKKGQFSSLKGDMPSSIDIPTGCRFRTRCPMVFDRCVKEPDLIKINSNGTRVACWLYESKLNQKYKVY
ncbi:Oligopeptide transport ATP-binding protein OppF (TC 3.A.1.5.1) [Olavius sp. associated proteobacterium Delta 1]|nr:Oligopeptide transport ATP-binding protein OppF (TC 3.A.1.5.1) [Olavius sp. associated proteobacterium Delta 1]